MSIINLSPAKPITLSYSVLHKDIFISMADIGNLLRRGGHSSVVGHMLGMHEVPGSIPMLPLKKIKRSYLNLPKKRFTKRHGKLCNKFLDF